MRHGPVRVQFRGNLVPGAVGVDDGPPAHGKIRTHHDRLSEFERLTGNHLSLRHRSLHVESEAGFKDLIELAGFVASQQRSSIAGVVLVLHLTDNAGTQGQQSRNARSRLQRIEAVNDFVHLPATCLPRTSLTTFPNSCRCHRTRSFPSRFAVERLELVQARTISGNAPETLAAMAGTAQRRNLADRLPEQRQVAADIQMHRRTIARPTEGVPEDAFGLPRGACLGESRRIARSLERLQRQHRGGRVMAVRAARLRREPRHDHIRMELADHAHGVREHALAVPLGKRLLVALGITEIPRPGKKLLAAVDAPRGE